MRTRCGPCGCRRPAGADVAAGWGRVVWPNALDRGYPNAPGEWRSRTGQGRRLLVEGSVILPADVAPTLASPADALWLVPTRAFQAHHYAQRPWIGGVLRECVDPAAAFERWMERDVRFAAWLEDEVGGLGLGCIAVDGSRSVEEVAGVVAGWFGLGGSGEAGG